MDETKYVSVAIDGLDGSGKGSCVDEMSKIITNAGVPVIIADYPSYKYPWGEFLYHLLHENNEGLSVQDRFLVYALNRLETVFVLLEKIEDFQREYNKVAVIFDRYVTSNVVSLGFYLTQMGENVDYHEELKKLYPFMWEIDKYFVDYLKLQKTKIFVPILDAEETIKRVRRDDSRMKADFYERTDVQDLARRLYIYSSKIDPRIFTYSQFKKDENRYLTIHENALVCILRWWPEILKIKNDKLESAPVYQLRLNTSKINKELVNKLLNEFGSEKLKQFNPYK